MLKKSGNSKFLVVLFIVIVFQILILHYIFSFGFIYNDDVFIKPVNNLKHIFVSDPFNGFYISDALCKIFVTYLPHLLNMHPSYFKGVYFSYIASFIFIPFFFVLTKIISSKNDYIFLTGFVFVFLSILMFTGQQISITCTYDGFFRMLLPVLMWIVYFYLMTKVISYYVYREKASGGGDF